MMAPKRRRVDSPKKWFSDIRSTWGVLFQAGAWVLALFSGFVLSPPWEDGNAYKLASFVAAFVVGLAFVATRTYRFTEHRYVKLWVICTMISLAAALCVFSGYEWRFSHWIHVYHDKRKVIGDHLIPPAELNRQRLETELGKPIPIEEVPGYIEDNPRLCYVPAEIDQHQRSLLVWYVASETLLLTAVLLLIQTITCATAPANQTR